MPQYGTKFRGSASMVQCVFAAAFGGSVVSVGVGTCREKLGHVRIREGVLNEIGILPSLSCVGAACTYCTLICPCVVTFL